MKERAIYVVKNWFKLSFFRKGDNKFIILSNIPLLIEYYTKKLTTTIIGIVVIKNSIVSKITNSIITQPYVSKFEKMFQEHIQNVIFHFVALLN